VPPAAKRYKRFRILPHSIEQAAEASRVHKAKSLVEKAKGTANRTKELQATQVKEKKQKLASKLESAGRLKEEKVLLLPGASLGNPLTRFIAG